eukprot:3689117-Prymnesium_polylepis.1
MAWRIASRSSSREESKPVDRAPSPPRPSGRPTPCLALHEPCRVCASLGVEPRMRGVVRSSPPSPSYTCACTCHVHVHVHAHVSRELALSAQHWHLFVPQPFA